MIEILTSERYLGSLLLLVACSSPAEKQPTKAPTPPTIVAAPVTADAAAAPGLCAGAAEDAVRQHADAERVERSDVLDPLDVDGDGIADAVFRGGCGGFAGNCSFLLYRCTADSSTFLGEVVGFGWDSGPFCIDPPAGGTPCRLSIMRRMMHDDLQEELYDFENGVYARTGTGRYVPPRRGGKSRP